MPFSISKNSMTFTPDSAIQQTEYTAANPISIAQGTEYLLQPAMTLSADDKCHHITLQCHLLFPNVSAADLPRIRVRVTSAQGTQQWYTTVYEALPDGSATVDTSTSMSEPITEVSISVCPKDGLSFTIPANSRIHMAVQGNDAALLTYAVEE